MLEKILPFDKQMPAVITAGNFQNARHVGAKSTEDYSEFLGNMSLGKTMICNCHPEYLLFPRA